MAEMKVKLEIEGLADAERRVAALHTQWSEIAAMARDHKDAAVLCTQVAKLELAVGDALVLTTRHPLNIKQRAQVTECVRASLGRVVPLLFLDSGVTIAQVTGAPVTVASD